MSIFEKAITVVEFEFNNQSSRIEKFLNNKIVSSIIDKIDGNRYKLAIIFLYFFPAPPGTST